MLKSHPGETSLTACLGGLGKVSSRVYFEDSVMINWNGAADCVKIRFLDEDFVKA